MPPKFVASLRSFWDERRARSTVIGLTPFERAQRSWARSVASYADVPAEYASFFDPMRAGGAPFPLVVIAPSYEGFLHREVERLVCANADEITVLERRGHRLESHRFPFSAISCVEMRTVLLDARLKIIGLAGADRIPAEISVRFNAVTEFLFAPIVARIRSAGARPLVGTAEAAKVFEAWGKRDFKFMNYARRSLLGNEAVLQAILQPEIRQSIVSAFGRSIRRTVSPTHATILTERELISIQEVAYPGDQERYGGVWDFIPLGKITGLSVSTNSHDLVGLAVQLPGDTRFDFLYEASARSELDALVATVSELAHGKLEATAPPATSGAGHAPAP